MLLNEYQSILKLYLISSFCYTTQLQISSLASTSTFLFDSSLKQLILAMVSFLNMLYAMISIVMMSCYVLVNLLLRGFSPPHCNFTIYSVNLRISNSLYGVVRLARLFDYGVLNASLRINSLFI